MAFLKAISEGYRRKNRRVLGGALCLNIASQKKACLAMWRNMKKSGVAPKLSNGGDSAYS